MEKKILVVDKKVVIATYTIHLTLKLNIVLNKWKVFLSVFFTDPKKRSYICKWRA